MCSYLVSRSGPQSRKFSKVNGLWMDQQSHKMHKRKNVELKQSLGTVRQSVPAGMLHN